MKFNLRRGVSFRFSAAGDFSGRTIDEVADGLWNGTILPDQLKLKVVILDGITYTVNNRSSMTLRLAGVKPNILENETGNPYYENLITKRLKEIGASAGPAFVANMRGK